MTPFLVCSFDKSTLSNLVKESFGVSFPDVFHKKQIAYIYRYLKDLKAETILLEREYIDKDYLEDYSRYYVKCFGNSGHKCARLHFFSKTITHIDMESILRGNAFEQDVDAIKKSYLGFVVVKPLPRTFIGKTCLKMYDRMISLEAGRQCLWRDYLVDLFGISLSVRSIAFQEQDKVVSACATTSIWTSLNALSWRHVRDVPSCSEITTNAINHISGTSNGFPNAELSNKQIMRALDVEGLKHHTIPLDKVSQQDFLKTVKCFIDSGIPLIFGVDVHKVHTGGLSRLARHAVTVLGYNESNRAPAVYLHDDRLGPFARASFVTLSEHRDGRLAWGGVTKKAERLPRRGVDAVARIVERFCSKRQKVARWGVYLQEKDDRGEWVSPHEVLVPNSLIVPANKKVRLPVSPVENTCKELVRIYKAWLRTQGAEAVKGFGSIDFDISLSEISEIRKDVISHRFLNPSSRAQLNKKRAEFLTGSYARFQWCARFYVNKTPAFRIYFDATDIPQGDVVSNIFAEDLDLSNLVISVWQRFSKLIATLTEGVRDNEILFVGAVLRFLQPKGSDYFGHLDSVFGEPRAPLYLKPNEFKHGQVLDNATMKMYYRANGDKLHDVFNGISSQANGGFAIWAISIDGALLIGREFPGCGHPTLTGFKPARIAGEIRQRSQNVWAINAKSGRYSSDYANKVALLKNAKTKFTETFPEACIEIERWSMVRLSECFEYKNDKNRNSVSPISRFIL